MKTPPLLASFAVAASVTAADLKDPATVAREWSETTVPPLAPLTDDLSLKGQTTPAPRAPVVAVPAPPVPRRQNPLAPPKDSRLPESLYDAPLYRAPDKLPNARPRGAVPWNYNGEVYWLVPLSPPSRD